MSDADRVPAPAGVAELGDDEELGDVAEEEELGDEEAAGEAVLGAAGVAVFDEEPQAASPRARSGTAATAAPRRVRCVGMVGDAFLGGRRSVWVETELMG